MLLSPSTSDGGVVIVGGIGSGKTAVITELIKFSSYGEDSARRRGKDLTMEEFI